MLDFYFKRFQQPKITDLFKIPKLFTFYFYASHKVFDYDL